MVEIAPSLRNLGTCVFRVDRVEYCRGAQRAEQQKTKCIFSQSLRRRDALAFGREDCCNTPLRYLHPNSANTPHYWGPRSLRVLMPTQGSQNGPTLGCLTPSRQRRKPRVAGDLGA